MPVIELVYLNGQWVSSGNSNPIPGMETVLPGWTLVAEQNFDTPAGYGAVAAAYPTMKFYDGYSDTSGNGTYSLNKVMSVHDGLLDYFVHTENGVHYVCAPLPITGWSGQISGRYAVRMRSDDIPGYKMAFLLWSVVDNWDHGEVDFPEGALGGSVGAYLHKVGDPGDHGNVYQIGGVADSNDWHVYGIEWVAGSYIRLLLDGTEVGYTTNPQAIPTASMRWVLQVETNLSGQAPSDSAQGHVYVDWAAQWTKV